MVLPAWLVAITGGWLVAELDIFEAQIVRTFALCGTHWNDLPSDTPTCLEGKYKFAFIQLALFVGAVIGCLTCRYVTMIGRKFNLMLIAVMVIPGSLIAAAAPDGRYWGSQNLWGLLVAGRFISGIGMGWVCVTIPMYIAEVSPNDWRGFFNTMQWSWQMFGSFLAGAFALLQRNPPGPGTDYQDTYFDNMFWRLILLVPVFTSCVALVWLQFFTAEDVPFTLLLKGKNEKARDLMTRIHGLQQAEKELEVLNAMVVEVRKKESPFKYMRENYEYVHITLVVMAVGAFQNLSGARSLFTSVTGLFIRAGLDVHSAGFATVGVVFVSFLMTVFVSGIMDVYGRKTLLVTSFFFQASAAFIGAIGYWIFGDSPTTTILAIVSVYLFFVGYGIGVGPIPCMYMGEVFPLCYRGFGMGVGAACNWLAIAVMTLVTIVLPNETVFSLFFVISIIGGIIMILFMRETKNMSVNGSPYFKEGVAMGGG